MLAKDITTLLGKYDPEISGDWTDLRITFNYPAIGKLEIRSLSDEDLNALLFFRNQLSIKSRNLFCPYPWDNEVKLIESFTNAIKKSKNGVDASFITFYKNKAIGHFFLWKAGGNPHSRAYNVDIPELGIAVADDYQGKGLGKLQIEILKMIASYLGRDAIELTTALSNDDAWHTYIKNGFQDIGIIKNPLEVDATETITQDLNIKYREERHAVFIINENKREQILNYLSLKNTI